MQSKHVHIGPHPNANIDSAIYDIRVVQSATTSAGASVWAIRNKATAATSGPSKILYIKKIWFQLFQSGTGAATEMQYEWIKGTGCTAMTGGNAVTGLIKTAQITNADVDCRVLDTGLTQTNITQGAAFYNAVWSRLTHSATQAGVCSPMFTLDFTGDPIQLAPNEVLSLRQAVTSVIGDSVSGGVEVFGGLFNP